MALCLRNLRSLCTALSPLRSLSSLAGAAQDFTSLPVIDVAPLVNPVSSAEQKQAVGDALHDACLNVGFFYAKGHGLEAGLAESVMTQARHWFALPEEEKKHIALTPASHYRGWQRLASNVTQGRRDWHEGIDLYKEVDTAALAAAGLPPSPIHGLNPWPQDPDFQRLLRRYIAGCLQLGAAILRGISLGLKLPENYFEGEVAGDSYWVTRIIYYPPLQPASSQQPSNNQQAGGGQQQQQQQQQQRQRPGDAGMGAGGMADGGEELSCGEHTDYGLLTLVFQQAGVTALQVKNAGGQWVDAPPLPGTCVINIGDMFRLLTNGLYTPTAHRVLNASGKDRVSLPFFYEPNFEAVIGPHPQLCKGRPAQYEAVRYGTHLESKVLSNFDFQGGMT